MTAETASCNAEEYWRVTDDASVFAGELAAIGLAAQRVAEMANITGWRTFVIFTDSLSSVQCFGRGRCVSRPNLFDLVINIFSESAADVTLVWVPSHIGITGNEAADKAASRGARKNMVDMAVGLELGEAYSLVDEFVTKKWQEEWTGGSTGSYYRHLVPNVANSMKVATTGRAFETMVKRLRFGKCCVNAVLHSLGCHDTGLCDSCRVPETVQHLLLECTGAIASAVRKECEKLGIQPNLASVLGNASILTVIYRTKTRYL